MPKVRIYSVDEKEKQKAKNDLFEIIPKLKNKKEVFDFMADLFTESEILMVGRRIQVAKMILQGFSYNDIRRKMKVGFQTIYRVEHWLKSNEKRTEFIAGKIKVIKKEKRKTDIVVRNKERFSRSDLDKYPQHRLLKKIFD